MNRSRSSTWHSAFLAVTAMSATAATIAACYSGDKLGQQNNNSPAPSASTTLDAGPPFQPDAPAVYVQKVKNVLTGLPATDAEIAQVVADPNSLSSLVDDWMNGKSNAQTATAYQQRMFTFFQYAFQQTQIGQADLEAMIPETKNFKNATQADLLVENIKESFARTALAIATGGQPFTQTLTTHQLMMTPPLMALYAYMDSAQVKDDEDVNDVFANANPKGTFQAEFAAGPIPYADSINPASPNYMHFYVPDLQKLKDKGCLEDPIQYPMVTTSLFLLTLGVLDDYKVGGDKCSQALKSNNSQYADADFATWKMVTIRTPNAGEKTTQFYDVPTLKSTSELVLTIPRVGFFTTPAFFANWPTNTSNQDRAPMNQTLIVSTGMQVDGTDPTIPPSTPGLDADHAAPGTACYGCHQLLDPTRAIMQATYSYGLGPQDDAGLAAQKGLFAFQGVIASVSTIDDLATTLAQHPAFATAWAEKLCYYVNSQKCAPDDPEFQRIVADFKSSNYSWPTLVRELVSSPITTSATETKTADEVGQIVALSRRDQLCALLSIRLGLPDACQLTVETSNANPPSTVELVAQGLPSDGYGRGQAIPVLPNVPSLFYRAGTENMCSGIADELVDVPSGSQIAGATQYLSTDAAGAINSLVTNLMGLPSSDPRAPQVTQALQSHFADAIAAGATGTDALKSTFILACLSPSVVGMGM